MVRTDNCNWMEQILCYVLWCTIKSLQRLVVHEEISKYPVSCREFTRIGNTSEERIMQH